jgi:hypothetical protein
MVAVRRNSSPRNKKMQYTYKRDIKAPSRTHRCGGKAASIRYSECVYVALPACKAHASYCRLWPVRFYNIVSRYLMNYTIFKKNQ